MPSLQTPYGVIDTPPTVPLSPDYGLNAQAPVAAAPVPQTPAPMPVQPNPNALSVAGSRLAALGVMPSYTPPAATGAQSAPIASAASPLSWANFKTANNYATTDYNNKLNLWNQYNQQVIPKIAQATGDDPNSLQAAFQQQYAADRPVAPTRSIVQAFAEPVAEAINTGALGVKSMIDAFDPGNPISEAIRSMVDTSEANMSPVVKDAEARTSREVAEAQAAGGSGLPQLIMGYARSPIRSVAQAAGALLPYVVGGEVAGLAKAPAIARAGVSALAALQGAGQVRGAIYDRLQQTSDSALQASSPAYAQLRQNGLSEQDAKTELGSFARSWPEIFTAGLANAITARFAPVEQRLAGAPLGLGRLGAAALEGATNAAQGATNAAATNAAIQNITPSQPLLQGVGQAATSGGLLGALAGGAFGAGAAPENAAAAPTPEAATTAPEAPLQLPAPTYRLPAPETAAAAPGFTTQEGAATAPTGNYNLTPEDITAVTSTLPRTVSRNYVAQHLATDIQNGTLEETAQQTNSLGKAAQALLEKSQQRSQLPAPETVAQLPSPQSVDVNAPLVADTEGNVTQQTYEQAAQARAAQQEATTLGLTPDIRALLSQNSTTNKTATEPFNTINKPLTKEEVVPVANNLADQLRAIGYDVEVTHSGSAAGKSSYLRLSDPETGRFVIDPIRVSDHSKGAFNSQFYHRVNTAADVAVQFERMRKSLDEMRAAGVSPLRLAEQNHEQVAQQIRLKSANKKLAKGKPLTKAEQLAISQTDETTPPDLTQTFQPDTQNNEGDLRSEASEPAEPVGAESAITDGANLDTGSVPTAPETPERSAALDVPAARTGGMDADSVRAALDTDTLQHNVDVYPTLADAPEHIQEQARSEGADDIEGFFDPKTNRVALIASNIASPTRAREVARHELIGHYGLEQMVGQKVMGNLANKVIASEQAGNATFRKIGAEIDQTQPGLIGARRAKEIIATMAERNMQNSIVRRVMDGVRKFGKKIGLVRGDISDAEIAGLLRDTQQHLAQQGRNSIVSPGSTFNEPSQGALFSRSGATSIPLAEEKPTILDRIKGIVQQPEQAMNNARTLLSEGGSAPQPPWLEWVTTNFFDYRNPLEQLVRRTGATQEGKDFLNTMRTFEASTQKTLHDFQDTYFTPLETDLKNAWNSTFKKQAWYQGFKRGQGERQFLQDIATVGNLVKHGRERNAEIARKTEGRDLAGSGMTNEQIDTLENDIRQQIPGLVEYYEQLYNQRVRPMLDYRDETLRNAGLLTPEMEAARPKYDWYVPLIGDPHDINEDSISYQSRGTSLKSPKDKQAKGRAGTLADNVLQNVLETTGAAVRRAGMQDFKRSFIDFIKSNETAKKLAQVKINDTTDKEIFEKYVGSDGLVHERVKPSAALDDNAVVLRDGNQTTVLRVGNRKVLDALKGSDKGQIEGVFALPMRATRLLSAIYTRYNPVFPLVNKMRDMQSQISYVLADAPVADKFGAARRALANNAKYITQWRNTPDSEYHQYLTRLEKLGGVTSYSHLFTDDVMNSLEEEFARGVGATTKHQIKAKAAAFGKLITSVNEHMELTSRVALFKALIDSGMAEKDAALYAKNVMNFEMKGKLGKQLGALYSFAGPSLFDARRMLQSLRTPRGAAVMLAHYLMMYGLYGAFKAMSGQDDDGIDRLDKVPVSQTGRYLTLLDPNNPDGLGWKFPVGFGYARIALTLAAATHRFQDGVDNTGSFLSNIAKDAFLSNFSPVDPTDVDPTKDFAGWAMQQFIPTVAKPLLQLAMNTTGQGSPIHKPDEWTGNKLKFEQAWPSTSLLFRGLAKDIYDNTGIDMYPESLYFLMRSYGGGAALDAIRGIEAVGEKAGTDMSLSDLPLLRTFGSRSLPQDVIIFRQNSDQTQQLVSERQYAQQQGNGAAFDAQYPNVAQAADLYKRANNQIKGLLKERQAALAQSDPVLRQQQALDVNRRIRHLEMMTNQAYKEMQGQ